MITSSLNNLTLGVVDDTPSQRATVTKELKIHLGLNVESLAGPFMNEEQAFNALKKHNVSIAICDHHLEPHNYARFTGAELVSWCYKEHFPAILVTRYSHSIIEQIRPFRHRIPALLTPRQLTDDVDYLQNTLSACMREVYLGEYSAERRPWQTLLRVEDIDEEDESVYLIIPGWDAPEGENAVKIPLSMIPDELHKHIRPKARLFAQVNLGATKNEDLYIKDFSFRG